MLTRCTTSEITKPVQRREEMLNPEDVMRPDLLSQILLVGSGTLILVTLLVIVVAALTHVAL